MSRDRGHTDHGSGVITVSDRCPEWPHPVYIGHYTERSHRYHSDTTQAAMPGCALFTYTISGAGRFWDDGHPVRMEPGMAHLSLLKEPRTAWGFDPALADHWEFIGLVFSGEAALTMLRGQIARSGRVLNIGTGGTLIPRLLALADSDWEERRLDAVRAMELVSSVLQAVAGATSTTAPPADPVQRAEALLRASPARPPSVATLARRVGLSREHLTRAFTAAYGRPPQAWARALRLAEAQRLLADGRWEVAEVASRLGWASVPAFHRAFTASCGVTPGAWRRLRV